MKALVWPITVVTLLSWFIWEVVGLNHDGHAKIAFATFVAFVAVSLLPCLKHQGNRRESWFSSYMWKDR